MSEVHKSKVKKEGGDSSEKEQGVNQLEETKLDIKQIKKSKCFK